MDTLTSSPDGRCIKGISRCPRSLDRSSEFSDVLIAERS